MRHKIAINFHIDNSCLFFNVFMVTTDVNCPLILR